MEARDLHSYANTDLQIHPNLTFFFFFPTENTKHSPPKINTNAYANSPRTLTKVTPHTMA